MRDDGVGNADLATAGWEYRAEAIGPEVDVQ